MQRTFSLAAGATLIFILLLGGASFPADAGPAPAQQLSGAAAQRFLAGEGILEQLPDDDQPSTPAHGRNFMEPRPLTPADGAAGDALGLAVAVDGETLAVSAHRADGPGGVDQGAVYVFSRAPSANGSTWSEGQKLTAGDGAAFDLFGSALALDGDTLLVGALDADIDGNVDQGAAYLFTREGDGWSEGPKLTAGDGAAGDEFAFSVALDDDMALIGAYRADAGANENQGAAYVFTREGPAWSEQQKLIAADGAQLDHFAFAVALDGEVAIIGAPDADVAGNNEQGAAYLFSYDGTSWSEQYKLTAGDGAAGDQFGVSLALEEESAMVGAFAAAIDGKQIQGAVYVFMPEDGEYAGGVWSERQKLTAGDGLANDYFGFGLALDGDTLVVCAYGVDVDGNSYQGAAYLFTRGEESGLWSEQQKFLAGDGGDSDFFGISAGLDGDIAVVGAYGADVDGLVDAGKVYLMERGPMPWPDNGANSAADGEAGDNLGVSVALQSNTAVVGAYHHVVAGNADQGAAYVFTRNGSTWVQQQKLVAGDGREGDFFGVSLALDGETLVVGAFRADVGGNSRQGAAYVFTRAGGGSWSQQQKLTAGDGRALDQFGGSVGLDGDTIVAGAALADVVSNVDQGAVYSFALSGGVWVEQQKVVAGDWQAGALFGRSLALQGNSLLVGAPGSAIKGDDEQGAAYYFTRAGSDEPWNEQQKLLAADGEAGDFFGAAAAMAGNSAMIGAYLADIGETADQGAAYLFGRSGGVWSQRQKLAAADGAAGDYFGYSVALDGAMAVVGAPQADIGGRADQGAAYVFAAGDDSWLWEQKLLAGDGVGGDYLGFSAALNGETGLLGAIRAAVAGNEGQGRVYFFSRERGYFGYYLPAVAR